jgi:aspartate/methionine/tyrosine aminotransferase
MPVQAVRASDRVSVLKPTAVNSVLAEVTALRAQGRTPISLMRGEPDFRTPEHIVEAAVRSLSAGRTTYADNRGEIRLRRAVAEKLARDNSASYDPGSEILITDGATLGVYAALMALLNPGDQILLPDPIYDAYQSPVRLAGAETRPVRSQRTKGRFRITTDDLDAAWTPKTRALLLNTPWNPVGTVLTKAEIAQIAEFVERRDLTLISDEIYESITYGDHRHISPASISAEIRNRCVIVNSFSKSYAMTGWRLGYCAAPKELIHAMFLVLQQSSRGPATFIQDAGAAALSGPQQCVDEMRRIYAERRGVVIDALSGLPAVQVMPPEGGFFAMVDVRQLGKPSDEIRKRLLRDFGVVVMHGAAYGEGGEGTLRVSFASGGENLTKGLELLRAGLSSL